MPRFDIEDAFQKIGRVSDVWVARKPPGFAFIEMEVNNFLHQPHPSISSKLLQHHCHDPHNALVAGQEGRRGCLQGA